MKIITILGNASSAHILNWSKTLASQYQINLISLNSINFVDIIEYNKIKVKVFTPPIKIQILEGKGEGALYKIFILLYLPWVWYLVWKLNPKIIHVHYATSYGLIGALIFTKSIKILSVWGSDIFNFPKISFLHKSLIVFILSRYKILQVTSYYMISELRKYTENPELYVVPFPIDCNRFRNIKKINRPIFTIGTIKTLHPKYGIDKLLQAAAILKDRNISQFKIKIFGRGPQEIYLKKLAYDLGLDVLTEFMGYVAFDKIHLAYNELDIYVALSVDPSETYGVAILEACSSEIPVIVSDVGGLPEVVIDKVTGIVVPDGNPAIVAQKLEMLIRNDDLRASFGLNGRNHVLSKYSETICKALQSKIYKGIHNV